MSRRHQRGMTLIEILVSLAMVMTGMLGLLSLVGTSAQGSASAQRFSQAQARGQQIIEAIRTVPVYVLNCLTSNPVSNWATCEANCRTALGASAAPQACVFVSLATTGQDIDATQQRYAVVTDPADATRSTWVTTAGVSSRVFDVQVTIGWNDEGAATPPTHYMTFRTAVFP